MEHGLSGPTAVKDINPAGTGLSDVAAAFLAANCSPFTNPRDMPVLPKVPDPRNTQPTKTMFIWGHCDIPVVTGPDNAGHQCVISSADPLSPIPVTWGSAYGIDQTVSRQNPNDYARRMETYQMVDIHMQMRELGKRSKAYRVVGHGLKVWVSRNTTVSRGNIEAGQFNVADTRNFTNTSPAQWDGCQRWTNAPGTGPELGVVGTVMQCTDIGKFRSMLSSSKEQEVGFLAADEGATVRWTDSNDFQFQPSIDRGCVFPSSYQYNYKGFNHLESVNTLANGTPVAASSSIQFQFTYSNLIQAIPDLYSTFGDFQQLGTLNFWNQTGSATQPGRTVSQQYYSEPQTFAATSGGDVVGTHGFYGIGERPNGPMVFNTSDNGFAEYVRNPDSQFNKGLYVDVSGVDPGQFLTVQVCWHVEYIPKGNEPWDFESSPVDTEFDTLVTLARDRLAFPIVVKGHSFFSSLKKALGKAFSAFGKLVSSSAPAISAGLAAIPDPRAQAAAAAVGMAGGLVSQFTRKRVLEAD